MIHAVLGGLGFWEIAVILGVILLIFGPKKLPELARNLGKGIREFKKATSDFRSTVDFEMNTPPEPPPAKQLPPKSEEDAEVMPVDEPKKPAAEKSSTAGSEDAPESPKAPLQETS